MEYISTLQKLEPVFKKAGELACQMQQTAKSHNKSSTGLGFLDIVTEADLKVQEFLLKELSRTSLKDCRLLAEEDTPATGLFNPQGKYFLAIDPIDGTGLYSKGSRHFNVMVSLHDGKQPLYSFKHYPALGWTCKIYGGKVMEEGTRPEVALPDFAKTSIVYYNGKPEELLPQEYEDLSSQGFRFVRKYMISAEIGATTMYALGKVAGYYMENPNCYDGLFSLHHALANKRRIVSKGPKGAIDLSDVRIRESGMYYPGCYLALA